MWGSGGTPPGHVWERCLSEVAPRGTSGAPATTQPHKTTATPHYRNADNTRGWSSKAQVLKASFILCKQGVVGSSPISSTNKTPGNRPKPQPSNETGGCVFGLGAPLGHQRLSFYALYVILVHLPARSHWFEVRNLIGTQTRCT
jgi:hypothetical protein